MPVLVPILFYLGVSIVFAEKILFIAVVLLFVARLILLLQLELLLNGCKGAASRKGRFFSNGDGLVS